MIERGPNWEMRLGDCIEGMRELADLSVDVVITDPPYEAEAHEKGKRQGKSGGTGKEERGKAYNRVVDEEFDFGTGKEERGKAYNRVVDEEFDFAPITEQERLDAAFEFGRIARTAVAVFCQVEAAMLWRVALERGGLVYRRTIPWVKPDAMPSLHGRWPGQAFESIVLALKPSKTVPIGGKSRYYNSTRSRGDARAHDTAKPLSLMLEMVEDFSNPGETVLDAFAGSGTTGVACIMQARKFLGFEKAQCARCKKTARWRCEWPVNGQKRKAYLCDDHMDVIHRINGSTAIRENMFDVARRRLNGDEAKPRPEQPSLFGAL